MIVTRENQQEYQEDLRGMRAKCVSHGLLVTGNRAITTFTISHPLGGAVNIQALEERSEDGQAVMVTWFACNRSFSTVCSAADHAMKHVFRIGMEDHDHQAALRRRDQKTHDYFRNRDAQRARACAIKRESKGRRMAV